MRLKRLFRLVKDTASEWSEDNVPMFAAALAYYTIFSLAPLLLIAIAIAGSFFGKKQHEVKLFTKFKG